MRGFTVLAIVGNEMRKSCKKKTRHTHIFHNLTKSLGEAHFHQSGSKGLNIVAMLHLHSTVDTPKFVSSYRLQSVVTD